MAGLAFVRPAGVASPLWGPAPALVLLGWFALVLRAGAVAVGPAYPSSAPVVGWLAFVLPAVVVLALKILALQEVVRLD